MINHVEGSTQIQQYKKCNMTFIHVHKEIVLHLDQNSFSAMILPVSTLQRRYQVIILHMTLDLSSCCFFCKLRCELQITDWAKVLIDDFKMTFLE